MFPFSTLLGLALAGLLKTPLLARADAPINSSFPYGSQPVRGVNLGGWLVLEPWITPELFDATNNSAIVDEFTFGQLQDRATAEAALKNHWDTFYTEQDFADIAAAGLNHVRVPIGYWAFDVGPGESYISGQKPYLEKAVQWAGNHGLKVIVDLHGAPGSQNGFDNSGQKVGFPGWHSNKTNVDRTNKVVRQLALKFINQTDVVPVIAPLNEPAGFFGQDVVNVTKQFWRDAYQSIRFPTEIVTSPDTLLSEIPQQVSATAPDAQLEPTLQNATTQASAPQNATAQDSAPQNATVQDAAPHDATNQNATFQDATLDNSTQQISARQNAAPQTNTLVLIHDAFQPLQSWNEFMPPPAQQGVALDTHIYQVFSNDLIAMNQSQHIAQACRAGNDIAAFQGLWTIVGEWSPAMTDCAKYLNGRGIGARFDGTFSGSPKVGSCQGFSGSASSFSDEYKTFLRQYWEAQVTSYERGAGWIQWLWKGTGTADEWSYKAGLQNGWIPQNPSERKFPNVCTQ